MITAGIHCSILWTNRHVCKLVLECVLTGLIDGIFSSLACCSGGQVPIHLWDAYGGKLAASYSASNNVYELVSARSLHFTPDGRQIVAGYEKFISIFDISRPGLNGSYIRNKNKSTREIPNSGH